MVLVFDTLQRGHKQVMDTCSKMNLRFLSFSLFLLLNKRLKPHLLESDHLVTHCMHHFPDISLIIIRTLIPVLLGPKLAKRNRDFFWYHVIKMQTFSQNLLQALLQYFPRFTHKESEAQKVVIVTAGCEFQLHGLNTDSMIPICPWALFLTFLFLQSLFDTKRG